VKSQFERLAKCAPPEAAEQLVDAREDVEEAGEKLERATRAKTFDD
jgi:hypothetical protein